MKIKAIIFDLDGTVVNSLEDLKDAANYSLRAFGYPEHDENAYKYFVGNGARKLIERAVPKGTSRDDTDKVFALYSEYYPKHSMVKTAPYPQIPEVLKTLKDRGYLLAVVSNKPDNQTQIIMNALFEKGLFTVVSGYKPEYPTKPDPSLTLAVIKSLGLTPEQCLFVGDSGVDMQTAQNSGAFPVGVTWGLRKRDELEENGAKEIIDDAVELLGVVSRCEKL